jgi:hypothetical protein
MREGQKSRVLILVLVLVIVALLGVIAYTFAVRPAISGYTVQAQTQGYQIAVLTIAQQAAKCQQVPLVIENQTITLIAVECLQQAVQQQTAQTSQTQQAQ